MKITKDPRKRIGSGRTKDYPLYRKEPKPWGDPPYPGRALHPSVEIHNLYRTALRLGGDVANLGTYRGATASAMAHGVKDAGGGMVYAVDFYEDGYVVEGEEGENEQHFDGAFNTEQIKQVFDERGLGDYATFCKGHTNDWAKWLSHKSFNLVFIDADHHYEACLKDFQLWSPLVAPEGEIAFHDVDMNTVSRVIDEELDEWELVEHVYRTKTFRRKK
jgi:hypothetical protein